MATGNDDSKCAKAASLEKLPANFGDSFLPFKLTLRQRQRGKAFSTAGYVDKVILTECDARINVSARCFHSQMKSKPPHSVMLTINDKNIADCFCSCKAGYANSFCMLCNTV